MESKEEEQDMAGGGGGGGGNNYCYYYWGKEPETEEEYYASQHIRCTKSYFRSTSSGLSLFTRSWLPPPPPPPPAAAAAAANNNNNNNNNPSSRPQPRGLVFMVHGYGNDISWTFQSTPIFLAQHGYACFALDLPGHGRSHGLRGFVPDLDSVVDDCIDYFDSVQIQYRHEHQQSLPPPCFLYGESMGAAICLLIHLRRPSSAGYAAGGAVLVAPMCKISESIRPRWPIPQILTLAARFFPTLPIVPTADLVDKSVKVQEKRLLAARNPMRYTGRPRLGTVMELLRATDDLCGRLPDVDIPFIVLHGSADVVTDPEVSRELYGKARSRDKSMIKIYEGMMHSLLFGETDHNVDMVRGDILAWLDARCTSYLLSHS